MKALIFRSFTEDSDKINDEVHLFKDDDIAENQYNKFLRRELKIECVSTSFINNFGGKTQKYTLGKDVVEVNLVSVH